MDERLLRTPGLTEFLDPPVPEGESPYVAGAAPRTDLTIAEPDPTWRAQAVTVIARIRAVLPDADVEHVGSTSVPGLPAKPIIDLDLVVPDPDDEEAYLPALETLGFVLVVREPWWYGHRSLRGSDPAVNLHVFPAGSPESARHRLFPAWLREHPADRDRYAAAKRAASAASSAAGEDVEAYTARKEAVIRDIYAGIFAAIPR